MKFAAILYCILGIIILSPIFAFSTIIHIPDDQPTIQAGIDTSSDGDTVLIWPATYVENINYNGRNIVLASLFLITDDTSYISSTIIDGDSSGSVVTFENGEDSTAKIVGLTIQNGYDSLKGGIYCNLSSPTITNNIIRNNSAYRYGGGISCHFSSPLIFKNEISDNSAVFGGGIFCGSSNPVINANNIKENSAAFGGGITLFSSTNPIIIFNTIKGNRSSLGGGIFSLVSNPDIISNTISGNLTVREGAGLYMSSSSITLEKNIIAFNDGDVAIYCDDEYVPILTCCDIFGNEGGDWVGCISDQANINGNFSRDPLFCDSANDDFHISVYSRCAPANNSCGELIGALNTACEIYAGPVWHVAVDGDDIIGNGMAENPFASIQRAIDMSYDGDTVLVYPGTYEENIDFNGHNIVIGSLFLIDGDDSYISSTVIDGKSLNSAVRFASQENSTAEITGFTMQNGHNITGGGIYCYKSNPTIKSNIITNNSAAHFGGGIYCEFSNPTIINNTICDNSSISSGAGLCLFISSPVLQGNIISFNVGNEAVYCSGNSVPDLACCDIFGNQGGDWVTCIAGQLDTNGNFSADPLFCDTAAGNYHLSKFSPCLPPYNNCETWIGALGIACDTNFACGDANKDGTIDAADVSLMIDCHFWEGLPPDPYLLADVNCDAVINLVDIAYLIEYIFYNGSSPCCE